MADPHFEQKDEGESDVLKAPREEIQALMEGIIWDRQNGDMDPSPTPDLIVPQ